MIFPRSIYNSVDVNIPQTSITTALVNNAYWPASGSFVDASKFDHLTVLVKTAAMADNVTFAVYQDTSATATGSIKALTSATATLTATTDNGKVFVIEFNPAKLDTANNFRYVTLKVTGVSGSNYACIAWLGTHARSEPVTQTSLDSTYSVVLGG
jgi:hypothetical protein